MTDIAISVRNISKCYHVFDSQRSRLLHAIMPNYHHGMQDVWALKDVSLEIKRGEAVAIIGCNGSGKSTLLEILTGTLTPTAGDVNINGRVSALLELGSGFNPEYTGRDNVMMNGLLLGLSRAEILERFSEVEAFAEIGAAIDRPVKTYSSGMIVRLAFSVQILVQPEILIVDEALGVGDVFFQQKCFARLRQMREEGLTLLFVSHDLGTVRDICERALYLQSGEMQYFGETTKAIQMYLTKNQSLRAVSAVSLLPLSTQLFSKLATDAIWSRQPIDSARLVAVQIFNLEGDIVSQAKLASTIRIQAHYRTPPDDESLTIGLAIKNRYDQVVCSVNSAKLGVDSIIKRHGDYVTFEFEVALMLEAGLYTFRVNISRPTGNNRSAQLDTTDWFGPMQVLWDYEAESAPFLGMFGLPIKGRLI